MILVLADDITGAAEIAGVALSYGRRTFLSMGHIPQDTNNADVIVIATDIRSGDKENAAFVIKRLCRDLKTTVSENKTGLTKDRLCTERTHRHRAPYSDEASGLQVFFAYSSKSF